MCILAVVPNSAGVKQLFSAFSIIHNRLRNCLSPQVVHKRALVKAVIKHVSGKNNGTHLAKCQRHKLEEDDGFVKLLATIHTSASHIPSRSASGSNPAAGGLDLNPS
jgi:hypothetical protein